MKFVGQDSSTPDRRRVGLEPPEWLRPCLVKTSATSARTSHACPPELRQSVPLPRRRLPAAMKRAAPPQGPRCRNPPSRRSTGQCVLTIPHGRAPMQRLGAGVDPFHETKRSPCLQLLPAAS